MSRPDPSIRLMRAQARVRQLRASLLRYGAHLPSCRTNHGAGCSCGFTSVRAAAIEATKADEVPAVREYDNLPGGSL